MTREQVKAFLPILKAFAKGKVIQVCDPSGKWQDRAHDLKILTLIEHPEWYRVKSESNYRPFANAEECWKEMQKHHSFGFIKSKRIKGLYVCIARIYNCSEHMVAVLDFNEVKSAEELFNDLTFADGAPFGIKEEKEATDD